MSGREAVEVTIFLLNRKWKWQLSGLLCHSFELQNMKNSLKVLNIVVSQDNVRHWRYKAYNFCSNSVSMQWDSGSECLRHLRHCELQYLPWVCAENSTDREILSVSFKSVKVIALCLHHLVRHPHGPLDMISVFLVLFLRQVLTMWLGHPRIHYIETLATNSLCFCTRAVFHQIW